MVFECNKTIMFISSSKYLIPTISGTSAAVLLLSIYLTVLTLISGWSYTMAQFALFWPYITVLAVGFGIQVALYFFLRQTVRSGTHKGTVAVSGTTSTAAMLSCCAHYLANIIPVLGATGIIVFVSQYQIELFWFGILANLAGIGFMLYKIKTFLYA